MTYWIVLAVLATVFASVVYMVSRALSMETRGYGHGGYGKLSEGDRQAQWEATRKAQAKA
ncbi:MAG: hypothetical protein OEW11_01930 [Nitrospirota bacterium]|nr:hypothetical protein [Nitrospirota bacterium]